MSINEEIKNNIIPAPDITLLNLTKPDEPDLDNEYVAQKILGLISCDEWCYINFGSAGGAALSKSCTHENEKCYPSVTTGNMNGKVGGCPEYNKRWSWCKKLVEYWNNEGWCLSVTFGLGWIDATIAKGETKIMSTGNTIEEAIVRASVDLHKSEMVNKND